MEFATYRALCADPTTQSQFLEKVTALLEPIPLKGEGFERRDALAANITVGGKPFLQSKYLAALEDASGDWDMDEDDVAVHRFVTAAKTIAAVHPDLNVPSFVFGFANLPGADMPVVRAKNHLETTISTGMIGAPGIGRSVLAGGAVPNLPRVNISTDVHADNARRAMRPS